MKKYLLKKTMKKLLLILMTILLCFTACKTIQYVPIKGDTVVEYRDTTIWKDSLIYTPVEVVKEVVPQMDTLNMETSLATATAYVDTNTNTLKGKIENKKGITEQIKWREKIVYKDSIVTQEVPVEVQVTKEVKIHPWYERILWILSLAALVMIGIKIYPLIKKIWLP